MELFPELLHTPWQSVALDVGREGAALHLADIRLKLPSEAFSAATFTFRVDRARNADQPR